VQKIRPYTESLNFLEHFEVCLTKFRHKQILPNKINSSYSSYLLGEIYPFGLAFVGMETEIDRWIIDRQKERERQREKEAERCRQTFLTKALKVSNVLSNNLSLSVYTQTDRQKERLTDKRTDTRTITQTLK
jgi:hypothetical protein